MFRTALRNVLAHKARLMMTVLAVLLGVAFVSGTLIFTDTIGDALKNSSAKSFEDVSVAIRSEGGPSRPGQEGPGAPPEEKTTLDQQLLDKVRALPGAGTATGSVSGFTAIADKKGKLIGDGWSTRGGNYSGENDIRYPMRDGRAPAAPSETALDSKTVERAGFSVGDTVRMSVNGPVLEQKLVGVFTTDDGNVAAGGSLALFDTPTAQKLFALPGEYDEIAVKAAPGTSETALKAEIENILPEGTEATTGKVLADEQADQIAESTSAMSKVLLAFAGVALFVGIFIIANTFTMLVAQRTRELALLRAVGATRRQVTRSVLIESLVVGTIAAVVGFGLGVLIAIGMRAAMGAAGGTIPDGSLIIAPGSVIAALLVGVLVTVLAAWLPARRAAKIPPIAAMSSVDAAPTVRGLVVRNTIGGVLTAAGVGSVLAGVSAEESSLVGLGAAVTLVGVIVLTPLLSRPVIAAASPALRLFGVSGKLARQNAVRNPRRTAATAAALMIGLTLISAMTVLATSVQQGIDKMAADSLKADYTISMANFTPLAPEVAEKLESLPEVTAASPIRLANVEFDGGDETVAGVNPASLDKLVTLDFSAGSLAGLKGDAVIVDKDTAKDHGWRTGDSVPVVYGDDAKATLTIGGIYGGNEMLNGVMIPTATLDPHLKQIQDMQVMITTRGGETAGSKDAVEKALGDNPAIQVQTTKEISDQFAALIGVLLNMLYGLLAMAVIIAVIGVVNTLAMSVFERSREIGMLRAIGLDRGRVKRMVRLESLVISLFGAVLGIGLGAFLAWAAGELIKPSFSTYSMVVPWDRFAVFLLLAAAVGILAALWPARRAARLNVLSAIKSD